jgi:class 3 adenylate cyclase
VPDPQSATVKRSNTAAEALDEFRVKWIGERTGAAERRQVTVLCTGISLPPASGRDSDPEALADELVRFRGVFEATVARYGGFADPRLGRQMMAYWGFPRSEPDPGRLAVLAALDLAAANGPSVQVRSAVDAGVAVTGPLGSAPEATVVGGAQANAELLQAAAAPGAVLVSDKVREITLPHFEYVPAAERAGCWHVKKVRRERRRVLAPKAPPMVGQDAALERIARAWTRVLEGDGQYLVITGEAGIGKSRALTELGRRAMESGGECIELSCLPELRTAPLHSLRLTLRELLGDRSSELSASVAALDPAARNLVEVFAGLAGGVAAPGRRPAHIDNPARLFAALHDLFAGWAERRPLLLACEDLHWADEGTLEFVDSLARRRHELGRVCIACTWRSSEPPPLQALPGRLTLELQRLSRPAIVTLLSGTRQGTGLSPDAVRQIAERSEGIPLFALELARLHADNRARTTADVVLEPGSLNSILCARLDSLGALKPLAQAAAVLGGEFEAKHLSVMLDIESAKLAPALDALVELGFLTQRNRKTRGRAYRFAHTLLRDAAYASLLKSRRRQLHRRAAEAVIEEPAIAEQRPEIVAGHFSEGGDPERAFLWWRKAGEAAARISAARAAAGHFRRALALGHDGSPAAGQKDRADVLRTLAMQLAALKGNGDPEVVSALQQSLALTPPDHEARFDALWALHACHLVRGEIDRALAIGESLMSQARRDAPDHRRMRVHRVQGLAKLLAGRLPEAFSHYRLSLDLYDEERHGPLRFHHASDQGAIGYAQLAWGEAIADDRMRSIAHARAALALAARLQHPHTSAHVACVLAARAQALGDRRSASALAFAGRSLGERYEFPYWVSWGELILGWAEGHSNPAAALDRIENAIEAYQRTGARQALPYGLLLLAETAIVAEKCQQALQAALHGWHLAHHHGLALYGAELLRVQALARRRLAEPEEGVRALLREAANLARDQGAHLFQARAAAMVPGGISDNPRTAQKSHSCCHELGMMLAQAMENTPDNRNEI